MKTSHRVLVTRTDRMGDVFMSLQALRCLREYLPDAEIDFLMRPPYFPLLAPIFNEWKIASVAWPGTLENKRYTAALCLFDEPQLLAQLKRLGISVRVGNYSKLRSFLKLTHGIRQRRTLGRKNEGEFNLDLAKFFLGTLGIDAQYKPQPIRLPTFEQGRKQALTAMARVGVKDQGFWILHPGMGGSALNLGLPAYVKLIQSLALEIPAPLVLTQGPASADLVLVEGILDALPDTRLIPQLSLEALAEVFRAASVVVAPSTGPLHLAHYVGARTLGIYSPVRSHQPRRWEPWGGAGTSFILSPPHACPGKWDCLGKRCKHFYCMDTIAEAGLSPQIQQGLQRAGVCHPPQGML